MTSFSLFTGADLIGEFDTRQEAERAFDEAIASDSAAADELAVFEFDDRGGAPRLQPDFVPRTIFHPLLRPLTGEFHVALVPFLAH